MANGVTAPGTTPATGGLNYSDYQRRLQEAVARTREVQTVSPETKETLKETVKSIAPRKGSPLGPALQRTGEALVSQMDVQEQDLQARAARAASALETVGETTLSGVQRIEEIQGSMRAGAASAAESWDAAAEKADEYVRASRGRVKEVLTKLDDISKDMGATRDFSKSHAMQASVQAVTGSMKAEERNIIEHYGVGSKEYEQFRQSKTRTLATVQSKIHTSYAQLEEQQKTNYLNAVGEAYTKSNMYVGFQEQQHVEMLKYRDDSRNAYNLRVAELDATLEQMKMAGMENFANWLIETPTFSMDVTPLATALADLYTTREAQEREWLLTEPQAELAGAQARQAKSWAEYMETGKKPYTAGPSSAGGSFARGRARIGMGTR